MTAEIILTFEWNGTVHKETKGFKGGECVKKTDFLDKALGTAGPRTLKADYYAKEVERNIDHLRTGV